LQKVGEAMKRILMSMLLVGLLALTSVAFAQNIPEPISVECGGEIEGEFTKPDESVTYQLDLEQVYRLAFELIAVTDDRGLSLLLLDPDMNPVMSGDTIEDVRPGDQVAYDIEDDGTYLLEVSNDLPGDSSTNSGIGTFVFYVFCDEGASSNGDSAGSSSDEGLTLEDSILLPAGVSVQGSESMGEGELRLFAPEEVDEDDLILIRLEVKALNVGPVATAPPISLPTRVPTPSLLDQQNISLYTLMGAGIDGLDVDRFQIEPESNIQVLRLSTQEVNYWEWRLRALPGTGGDYRYLTVVLYVPEVLEDGRSGINVIYNTDIEIYVAPSEPAGDQVANSAVTEADAQPANAPSEEADGSITDGEGTNGDEIDLTDFSVIYSDPDSLTLIYHKRLNVETLKLRSILNEGWATDFPVMQLQENVAESGMCLRYVRYQSTPPLPVDCNPQSTFEREVTNADVFWYDFRENRLLDTAIYFQEKLLTVCSSIAVRCDLRIET
jgi:hypothetical protein